MFEGTCAIGLCMNIADLFQLQRRLHGHGKVDSPSHIENRIVLFQLLRLI